MKTVRFVLTLLALTLLTPWHSAEAADVICYNCPPEWADWASMLRAIKADLNYDIPHDNKNSGQALAQILAEKSNPVADIVYYGGTMPGVGLFLKVNQDRIGPTAIASLLAAASAACSACGSLLLAVTKAMTSEEFSKGAFTVSRLESREQREEHLAQDLGYLLSEVDPDSPFEERFWKQ